MGGAPDVDGARGLDDALRCEVDVAVVVEQDARVAAPLRPALLPLVSHIRVNKCSTGSWAGPFAGRTPCILLYMRACANKQINECTSVRHERGNRKSKKISTY